MLINNAESIAGKSIKKMENCIQKIEKFKKRQLKKKKKIILKNVMAIRVLKISNLRAEIINFQKEQVKARDNINKLRIKATSKLISKLSPILEEYAKKNSIGLILQKKNIVMGKKEIEITNEILEITNKEIKDINVN